MMMEEETQKDNILLEEKEILWDTITEDIHNYKSIQSQNLDKAIHDLRVFTSKEINPQFEKVLDSGLVPFLLKIPKEIDIKNKTLIDILWIITNLLSGTSEVSTKVIDYGAIDFLIENLIHTDHDVICQTLWGISNIAGESAYYRDYLLDRGVLPSVLFFINNNDKIEHLRIASWLVNNLCRLKPFVNYNLVKDSILHMNKLLSFNDKV